MSTAGGLVIHLESVHKEVCRVVPNAIEGRENVDIEIFGMEGVPYEDLQAHLAKKQIKIQHKGTLTSNQSISDQFAQFQALKDNPNQIMQAPKQESGAISQGLMAIPGLPFPFNFPMPPGMLSGIPLGLPSGMPAGLPLGMPLLPGMPLIPGMPLLPGLIPGMTLPLFPGMFPPPIPLNNEEVVATIPVVEKVAKITEIMVYGDAIFSMEEKRAMLPRYRYLG